MFTKAKIRDHELDVDYVIRTVIGQRFFGFWNVLNLDDGSTVAVSIFSDFLYLLFPACSSRLPLSGRIVHSNKLILPPRNYYMYYGYATSGFGDRYIANLLWLPITLLAISIVTRLNTAFQAVAVIFCTLTIVYFVCDLCINHVHDTQFFFQTKIIVTPVRTKKWYKDWRTLLQIGVLGGQIAACTLLTPYALSVATLIYGVIVAIVMLTVSLTMPPKQIRIQKREYVWTRPGESTRYW
ncbi:hypothetical protein LROSL1_2218 [Furfurilactobacillus rossiae]|uniref:hypothetical protein n=1 Tax=Furfurilactobacillus rossiae TaxID=231049 RepID=UPI0015B95407|nr:hypothetical protein [Furfurilactobacillus rossiae]MCF6164729.1 hypothetical protein [Furfurilactobacillus rossiae]QLE65019.1 hypothetical protein LROSL1_2218 [Furfurilactobacillus rossiae]